ncbi:peptidylprolyl isomerase [Candidatus Pelagibacter bacterium nBUS_28]|uniref:peptidylprolyl isomerase n=1 Tax=Candidatus Pelagibacter bacterium nBUS_28 TaxID=3374189 RepID=UPI003EB69990
MFKIKILIILITIILSNNHTLSIENKIVVKIDNQIITSLDISNEYKYLIALNPSLKNSKKEDLIKLSKRSIIQEKIKKIEIKKNFNNPKIPQNFLEQILQNVYSKIGIDNLDDFKAYLAANEVDFESVKNKLEIESLWNELIFIKFSTKIKIDEKKIRTRINKNNKFLKSYLLSEISFGVPSLNDLDNKFLEITNVINKKGFDFAALKYSVSPTANLGGKLNWISESSLNENIKKEINDLQINGFTKPIVVPGGFLILQVNDIRNEKIEIDIEKELKKIKNYEKNNQLNQYSKMYFNKIKKNVEIDEL